MTSSIKDHFEERLHLKAEEVANHLRRVAERIEVEIDNRHGSATLAAGAAVHALHWGVANADLPGLIRVAAELDALDSLEEEDA